MTDTNSLWLARLQNDIDKMSEKAAEHAALPMHTGFTLPNAEIFRRLDRLEGGFLKIGGAVIALLIGILGSLVWILLVAEKLLQTKPGP